MGNVADLPAQAASNCCCEKKAVYHVHRGDWSSPFRSTGESDLVSSVFAKSAGSPSSGYAPVVVLLGGTGVGKSNLGNYVLGRHAFESRNSQESVTSASTCIHGCWFGGRHPVRVVDCPGIGDTKGAGADQRQWDMTIEVLRQVGSITALVMVMRAGRFTKFDREVIATLRQSFGAAFWKNLCVFCTGANAKPGQLDIEQEGPKIRRKLLQIEREQGADDKALEAIQKVHIYAADLDPTLAAPDSRDAEFRFKPSLRGMSLEELLSLDLRIPPNITSMSSAEFRSFATSDKSIERWIEGNYFQLGLSRLAAFKADVMALQPFCPSSMARLADPPEDEKPPLDVAARPRTPPLRPPVAAARPKTSDAEGSATAEGTGPSESLAEDQWRYFIDAESLEAQLIGQDVVLLKGSWLLEMQQKCQVLPRRQDVPREAVWDAETLGQRLQGDDGHGASSAPCIVAVSYSWLTPAHPDPEGFHLQQLGPMIKAYASWNRTTPDNVAVFLDWCSVPQLPRIDDEDAAYNRALAHMHLWYAHAMTSTWLLSRVPEGLTPYGDRGWPLFEKAVSALTPPAEAMLDLGVARPKWNTWGQVLQDCRVRSSPPPSPEAFAAELARKAFTKTSDFELLARRYNDAFRGAFGFAEQLVFAGLHWGDREAVKMANLLKHCDNLRDLDLQMNDIGRRGAVALARGVLECPQLERLALGTNTIDADGQQALVEAWQRANKPDGGLELWEQRPAAPMVEQLRLVGGENSPFAMPSPASSGRGGSPRRVAAARRPTEDLAAMQMAELGARQAAFEARLHVAISRLTTTLDEVGGAVASPVATPASGLASPLASSSPPRGGRGGGSPVVPGLQQHSIFGG